MQKDLALTHRDSGHVTQTRASDWLVIHSFEQAPSAGQMLWVAAMETAALENSVKTKLYKSTGCILSVLSVFILRAVTRAV